MKRLLNILLFMCLAFAAMAQQKPPYVQTHTPQVLSNWATWSTQFMGLPSADAFTMPLYIPDSIKAKSVWIKTGAARGIFIYNPVSGLLEQVGNYKPTTDSLASVKFNKSGGSLTGKLYLFADAVDPLEPITKNQFDNYVTGITWKKEVKVATTANITLSGIQTIDGIALSVDDRVLVMNQTSSSQNGLYLVKSGAWVRTTDADTGPEISTATVLVGFGTLYKNTVWTCTNVSDPVIGTDAVAFGQMSGAGTYVNGTGLTLNANVFDVNYTTLDTRYKFTTLTGYGITDAIRNSTYYGGGFQTASIAISGSIYANGAITSDNAIQTTGQVRAGSVSSRGSGSAYDLYDITTDNLWRTYSTGNTLHLQVPNLGDVYTADYTTQVLTFIKSPVLPGSNMTGDINYIGAVGSVMNPLAGKGLFWMKNSDYAKIYFESTSDTDNSSQLIFETGDNRNELEGVRFRSYDGSANNTIDYFTANATAATFKTRLNVASEAGGNGMLILGQLTTATPKQLVFDSAPGSNYFSIQGVQQTVGFNQNILIQPFGGNVNIGYTTDQGYKLAVNGVLALGTSTQISDWAGNSAFARFGHPSWNTITSSGFMQFSDGSSYIRGTSIENASYGGDIVFRTSPNTSTTSLTERLRIFNNGHVGIGYPTDQGVALAVNGTIWADGEIRITGGVSPGVTLKVTGSAVNEKIWNNYATGNVMDFRTLDDTSNGGNVWMRAARTGTVPILVSFFTDVEINAADRGLILHSPNNARWRVTVNNSGALGTVAL